MQHWDVRCLYLHHYVTGLAAIPQPYVAVDGFNFGETQDGGGGE